MVEILKRFVRFGQKSIIYLELTVLQSLPEETQSLGGNFGSVKDANMVDSVAINYDEKFFLHYNFPPFSTGEARPLRGTSRREVGHGNLAQRALAGMIPHENPYTIR